MKLVKCPFPSPDKGNEVDPKCCGSWSYCKDCPVKNTQ